MRFVTSVTLLLALTACIGVNSSINVADGETVDGNRSTVNGSINVGREARVNGDLETVNGSANIGPGSHVGDVETVNGRIEIADDAAADSLETVNGQITIGSGVEITGDVEAVNGKVAIGPGSRVAGAVESVNGRITLEGADVSSLANNNGGMELADGARVRGDLRVGKVRRGKENDRPEIIIGRDCVVEGRLVFERPVVLRVHRSAQIGEIEGAEPEYFE